MQVALLVIFISEKERNVLQKTNTIFLKQWMVVNKILIKGIVFDEIQHINIL